MKNTETGIVVIIFLILGAVIGGFCWPYTINTWLAYFHKSPAVVFWQGALIGFVPGIGQLSIAFAVLTWILMLFLR